MNSNQKILIVDDNATNLKLASEVLLSAGFNVMRATDAATAIRQINSEKPSLILMDIELSDMNGLTLTRQLKSDPATQHIPIVALTAFARKSDVEQAFAAGCVGHVSKPIDTRALAEQVQQFLERRGQ